MGGKILKYEYPCAWVRLSVHAHKWHLPCSKEGGAEFCKQMLLLQSSFTIHRCVNDDNMCMNIQIQQ